MLFSFVKHSERKLYLLICLRYRFSACDNDIFKGVIQNLRFGGGVLFLFHGVYPFVMYALAASPYFIIALTNAPSSASSP